MCLLTLFRLSTIYPIDPNHVLFNVNGRYITNLILEVTLTVTLAVTLTVTLTVTLSVTLTETLTVKLTLRKVYHAE